MNKVLATHTIMTIYILPHACSYIAIMCMTVLLSDVIITIVGTYNESFATNIDEAIIDRT